MAQDAGAASCALFVEQAEAAVADSTVTTHAARASRRVPGMRRARNMAGPALRRVSSTCYEAVQEFPFEIHKSLPSNGLRISSLIKVVSLLARTYGKKSLALASWCAMTGGMRKIGWGVFRSIPLWGSNSRCPVDKKARRMDPHSISMETHHACYRRLSDYHQPQPRQLRGPDPLT